MLENKLTWIFAISLLIRFQLTIEVLFHCVSNNNCFGLCVVALNNSYFLASAKCGFLSLSSWRCTDLRFFQCEEPKRLILLLWCGCVDSRFDVVCPVVSITHTAADVMSSSATEDQEYKEWERSRKKPLFLFIFYFCPLCLSTNSGSLCMPTIRCHVGIRDHRLSRENRDDNAEVLWFTIIGAHIADASIDVRIFEIDRHTRPNHEAINQQDHQQNLIYKKIKYDFIYRLLNHPTNDWFINCGTHQKLLHFAFTVEMFNRICWWFDIYCLLCKYNRSRSPIPLQLILIRSFHSPFLIAGKNPSPLHWMSRLR